MEFKLVEHLVLKMKMLIPIILIQVMIFSSCNSSIDQMPNSKIVEENPNISVAEEVAFIKPKASTIQTRFLAPEGYITSKGVEQSFAYYLSNLPLQDINAKVHLYNGELKRNQNAQASIIKMDVGSLDLQQCADAVMRLRAEYLWKEKLYDSIQFRFTNGFNANYSIWRKGNRIQVKGNNCNWVVTSSESTTYASFREYLNKVFSYAGTLSLAGQLKAVTNLNNIQAGDVFIHGGSPGHAALVVQVAVNKKSNRKVFMLAQSYMPAQEIHILKNELNTNLSPWYSIDDIKEYLYTPEYTFGKNELMRF